MTRYQRYYKLKIVNISLLLLALANTSYGDIDYQLSKVSSGIYYHQGSHEQATEHNIGAIANVSFVIGQRCVAVIDSGGSAIEGQYLRQAIKQKTDLPVCYVINTHVHPDHIFGNSAFKDDDPQFVGHENLPAALQARQTFFAEVFTETLASAYQGTEFIPPTMTVSKDKPLTLDLGNRQLVVTAHPTAHTDNDLTVFDTKTKTLWAGDLLFIERIPVIDGSINGWITVSRLLQDMDVNYVIPGHGAASDGDGQQAWQNQLRYLTVIRDGIRAIIADFGTIEQAAQQVGLQEQAHWELFEHYHPRNITASFVELEWE